MGMDPHARKGQPFDGGAEIALLVKRWREPHTGQDWHCMRLSHLQPLRGRGRNCTADSICSMSFITRQ